MATSTIAPREAYEGPRDHGQLRSHEDGWRSTFPICPRTSTASSCCESAGTTSSPGTILGRPVMNVAWLALCVGLGIAAGLLSAEIIGLPLAPVLAFALVWFARQKGQGVSTLLSYVVGFELSALWIGLPAVIPSSFATPANPRATLALAGLLVAMGLVMAAAAFLPVVRGKLPSSHSN